MRIADTSLLYAFFAAEDVHHARARQALADAETLLVPAEVLTELCALLQRRFDARAAHAAGEFLWSQPNTEIQPSGTDILMAAWEEFKADPKLTFTDAVVVATCRELDASPASFDRRLAKAVSR